MEGIKPQLDPLLHQDCAIHPCMYVPISFPPTRSFSLQYWVRGSVESPNPIRKKPKVGPDKQINAINVGCMWWPCVWKQSPFPG